MADSDIPAEAVEAARLAIIGSRAKPADVLAERILAAALPHIRARVLAEVDAALRGLTTEYDALGLRLVVPIEYVLDVVRVAQEGTVRGPESHGERRTGPPDTEAHGAPEAGGTA
jgi:hypothetical protein